MKTCWVCRRDEKELIDYTEDTWAWADKNVEECVQPQIIGEPIGVCKICANIMIQCGFIASDSNWNDRFQDELKQLRFKVEE